MHISQKPPRLGVPDPTSPPHPNCAVASWSSRAMVRTKRNRTNSFWHNVESILRKEMSWPSNSDFWFGLKLSAYIVNQVPPPHRQQKHVGSLETSQEQLWWHGSTRINLDRRRESEKFTGCRLVHALEMHVNLTASGKNVYDAMFVNWTLDIVFLVGCNRVEPKQTLAVNT